MKRIFITASVLLAPSIMLMLAVLLPALRRVLPWQHQPGHVHVPATGRAGQSPCSNPVDNHNVLLPHERLRVRRENLHAAHRVIDPTARDF